MDTKLHFSSKTNEWSTPMDYFCKLQDEFGLFDLDPCCTIDNRKAEYYFTKENDGLSQSWFGKVFCNPPYGRGLKDWVKKCYEERENTDIICLLIPARTDTSYFHDYIYNKPGVEIRFIRGRLKFGDSSNSAPFPSMLCIFSPIN